MLCARVPSGSIVIEASSSECKVKSSGGTIPVPVTKNAPAGNLLARVSQSTRSQNERCIAEVMWSRGTRQNRAFVSRARCRMGR